MSQDKFKVIYTGEIISGFEIETATKQFAAKFKMPAEKAQKILQAGREITLNKQAEHIKAYNLKSTLEEIGMTIRLERVLVSNEENKDKEPEDKEEQKQQLEQNEKQGDDEPLETDKDVVKAPESWELDPIDQKSDDEIEQEAKNNQDGTQNAIKKNDFNYTGLSNSPVIGAKKQKTESPESTSENEDEIKEKSNYIAMLKGWFKKFKFFDS